LAPGDVVVFYTDGLVERRGTPIDAALGRLVEVTRTHGARDPEGLLDRLLEELSPRGNLPDDIALLAVQLAPAPLPRFDRRSPADPAELAPLRASLRAWLAASGVPAGESYEIVLSASEAAANAIEHPQESREPVFDVAGDVGADEIVLTVRDYGEWRAPQPPETRGRGLGLMRAFMDDVEIEHRDGGTRVTMRRRVVLPRG
jgi:anti-sigma regulatory factor (Ser/Thr protein kinase)